MTIKIDAIDRATVDLLIEDGRMSGTDMARRISNVTERAVRYRLDRLIREKIIHITAVVDPPAIGLPVILKYDHRWPIPAGRCTD
jgi:Lrp/AsnC family transcriptional regulator, regulator for asnA, asnC and gidA